MEGRGQDNRKNDSNGNDGGDDHEWCESLQSDGLSLDLPRLMACRKSPKKCSPDQRYQREPCQKMGYERVEPNPFGLQANPRDFDYTFRDLVDGF